MMTSTCAFVLMTLMLVAVAKSQKLSRADFAKYKRLHPQEFSGKFEGDIDTDGAGTRNEWHYAYHWPNGVVPYDISSMDKYSQSDIKYALKTLQQAIGSDCIRFVPRTTEKNYIYVYSGSGCHSKVGFKGGRQTLSLKDPGCVFESTIQHEFLHALGFMHEQSRSDRDQYIDIHWSNIPGRNKHNFNKERTKNPTAYNYNSVMHYGKYAFSTNGSPTMTAKSSRSMTLGSDYKPVKEGSLDAKRVRIAYGCDAAGNNNGGGNVVTQPPATTRPPVTSCKDDHSSCAAWKIYCHSNKYVKDNCHKTCGTC